MASYYSVVQYLPDPRIDERVNIGVVAFDDDAEVSARFLTNWERVSRFADADISFLRSFAQEFAAAGDTEDAQIALQRLPDGGRYGPELIRRIAGRWKNSIQLTEPRSSLRPVVELADQIAAKFLREPAPRVRNRGRRTAAQLAAREVRNALEEQLGTAGARLVKRGERVPGYHEPHEFDVVVVTDEPRLAAHGISFEIKATKQLDQLVDATLWAVDDVKQRDPDFPIGVATLPPRNNGRVFRRARRLFTELGADFITEDRLAEWAVGATRTITIDPPAAT